MSEYDIGFNDAINKVIEYADEQAKSHARLSKELTIRSNEFHYRSLALIDFTLYLEDIFKTHVFIGE